MRRRLVSLACAAAVGIGGALLAPGVGSATTASAPSATVSYFVMSSDAFSRFGRGIDGFFVTPPAGDTFQISGGLRGIYVTFTAADDRRFMIDLDAPSGQLLSVGEQLGPPYPPDGSRGLFEIQADPGTGCTDAMAQVRDIATAADSTVTRLDVVWTGCGGTGLDAERRGSRGELVVNEPRLPGIRLMPAAAVWNPALPGVPQTPTRFVAVNEDSASHRVESVDAPSLARHGFPVAQDGCSGRTLGTDGVCTIDVSRQPTAPGRENATLTLHSDAGQSAARLAGSSPDGRFRWRDYQPDQVSDKHPSPTESLWASGTASDFWIGRTQVNPIDDSFVLDDEDSIDVRIHEPLTTGVTYRIGPNDTDPANATLNLSQAVSGWVRVTEFEAAPSGNINRLGVAWRVRLPIGHNRTRVNEGVAAFNAKRVPYLAFLRRPAPPRALRVSIRGSRVVLHWLPIPHNRRVQIWMLPGGTAPRRGQGRQIMWGAGTHVRIPPSWLAKPGRYTCAAFALSRHDVWSKARVVRFRMPVDDD